MVFDKDSFEKKADLVKWILGYVMLFVLLWIHFFIKEVDIIIILIPALVMGLDISKLLKK